MHMYIYIIAATRALSLWDLWDLWYLWVKGETRYSGEAAGKACDQGSQGRVNQRIRESGLGTVKGHWNSHSGYTHVCIQRHIRCVYKYIWTCINHIYIHTFIHININVIIYIHVRIFIYLDLQTSIYLSIYLYIYIYYSLLTIYYWHVYWYFFLIVNYFLLLFIIIFIYYHLL